MNEMPEILYQDSHIIVVDKPVDLPVHKNDFMPRDAQYLTKVVGQMTGQSVYNVHRLDGKTSGVIVLAFSSEMAHELALQFEKREVQKIYYSIVRENPGEQGTFDNSIPTQNKRRKAKATTHYKMVKSIDTEISYKTFENISLSLVEVEPQTGRWHQIRLHFAGNRNDIIGDNNHGDRMLNKIIQEKTGLTRLFLHAGKLVLKHPVTQEEMEFIAPVPDSFNRLMEELEVKTV